MFGRITPTVRNLLIVNFGIYLIGMLFKLDINSFFGLRDLHSEYFRPYQFFTYMFLHSTTSFTHILFNMFALFIFGPLLEQFWGPKRFLIFYIVTGMGAGILYSGVKYFETNNFENAIVKYNEEPSPGKFKTLVTKKANLDIKRIPQLNDFIYDYADNPDNEMYISESKQFLRTIYNQQKNSNMVGASGAVFALLFAFGFLFPNTVLMLIIPPIPIKAKYLVGIYAVIEIFAGVQRAPGDNVAHYAHISGMLVAFILLKIWQGDRKKFF